MPGVNGAEVSVHDKCQSVCGFMCVYFEPVCACVVNNKALHWQQNEIFIHLLSKLKMSPDRPKTELQTIRPTVGQTDNQTGDEKLERQKVRLVEKLYLQCCLQHLLKWMSRWIVGCLD